MEKPVDNVENLGFSTGISRNLPKFLQSATMNKQLNNLRNGKKTGKLCLRGTTEENPGKRDKKLEHLSKPVM